MPAGQESDCFIIVGVSRPKLAALFLSVMLISLFLTFHILYDSAVYSIQVSDIKTFLPWLDLQLFHAQAATTISDSKISILTNRVPNLDNQPIVFPHRIHFPKTSRKLPQVSIIL